MLSKGIVLWNCILACTLYQKTSISHTRYCYTSLVLNGKFFGTYKSRTASSSVVFASFDSNQFPRAHASPSVDSSRPARVNKFCKHVVSINGENKVHLLAFVPWFKRHPLSDTCGKPISLWYDDVYDYCGFIPVNMFCTRAITSLDKFNGESVLFVVSCVE